MADFNQETERASEGKIQRYLGVKAADFYQDYPLIRESLHKCLTEKSVIQQELEYHPRSVDISHDAKMTFGFVAPDMVLQHIEDISERKKSEKAIKESEDRYNSLFINNPMPCYLWQKTDGDFKLVHFNQARGAVHPGKNPQFYRMAGQRIFQGAARPCRRHSSLL